MRAPFWAQSADGFEGPDYAPNPWDVVVLGGKKLPGVCKIVGDLGYKVDRQQPNGRDGATVIMRGMDSKEFLIECTVWTPRQWELLQDVIDNVWRKPNKSGPLDVKDAQAAAGVTTALQAASAIFGGVSSTLAGVAKTIEEQFSVDIYHPALAPTGVSRVVVTGMSLAADGPVPQSKTVRFRVVQYVPVGSSKSTSRKATGSKNSPKSVLSAPNQVAGAAQRAPANAGATPPSKTDGGPGGPPAAPQGGGV